MRHRHAVSHFSRSVMAVTIALMFACAPPKAAWKAAVLFNNEQVALNRMTAGNSVLLFPLIINAAFDTSGLFSPEALAASLRKRQQGDPAVLYTQDFEKRFLERNSRESLDSFYVRLIGNDILAIATSDSAWRAMPAKYALVIRLNKGMRIRSFDGVTKKKAVLEGELWETRKSEVVWRAQAEGYEVNAATPDALFIDKGVRELFAALPDFIPLKEVENW